MLPAEYFEIHAEEEEEEERKGIQISDKKNIPSGFFCPKIKSPTHFSMLTCLFSMLASSCLNLSFEHPIFLKA